MQADRLLWVWLSSVWSDWRVAMFIVKPETVIAWHRRVFRALWTWKSRRRIGRPSVSPDVRALIRTMSQANPRWGAPRIHGELLKPGIEVSQTTVATSMVRRRKPPSQTWRTFLANHGGQIVAADFFVVPTAMGRLLFVLVLLAHERRPIVTWPSLTIRRQNGPVNGSATRSRSIRRRVMSSTIAITRSAPG
jgi:hypothetical protein